jgi:hypothetical protein
VTKGYMDDLDYWVRIFVNGATKDKQGHTIPASGEWSDRFLSHPWVRDSVKEGWARDLRGHVIQRVKRLHMQRDAARKAYDVSIRSVRDSVPSIEDLMPDKDWMERRREDASREAQAKEWRNGVVEQYGSLEAYLQRHKPSAGRWQKPTGAKSLADVVKSLTPRSRAMAGEGEQ